MVGPWSMSSNLTSHHLFLFSSAMNLPGSYLSLSHRSNGAWIYLALGFPTAFNQRWAVFSSTELPDLCQFLVTYTFFDLNYI